METSILSSTQKYAASALFALALHHSQAHQKHPAHVILSKVDEQIGEGASANETVCVSDNSQLWIHDNSGLLLPVFRKMGLGDQAAEGLKETAGISTQTRHHVGSFLKLLSEENDGDSSERRGKELALLKGIDVTLLDTQNSQDTSVSEDFLRIRDYEIKCRERYGASSKELTDVARDLNGKNKRTICNISKEEEEEVDGTGSKVSEKRMEEREFLSEERKLSVLYELLSACVADARDNGKGYDARHRVALRLLATWLDVKWVKMEAIEIMVASSLPLKKEEKEDGKSRIDWKRQGVIGAAALTGGALLALTGGLAAPAIAQGIGVLAPTLGSVVPAVGAGGFAAAATATGSVAGTVTIAASLGAAGAGLAGSKMARRTADLDEFEFQRIGKNHNQGRLAVAIMVSGFVYEEEDFFIPWEDFNDNLERYVLKWESKKLIALNLGIKEWLASRVAAEVVQTGAMLTVMATLLAALAAPIALVTAADLIDNAWSIAVDRSDKTGKLLAEVLLHGLQGNRPVTLVGFSLGARVIFKCLQYLAETKGDNAGLIERVVLLGAPISLKDENWEDARKMVAGRFINVYYPDDWTLGIAFRASLLSEGLAGIEPVNVQGIENFDATELIEGHPCYLWMTKQILRQLDLDYYYPIFRTTHDKPQEQKSKVA